MSQSAVTVVITPREGHFMAERSLASVLADDAVPFELIYVDIASPPDHARAIRAEADARGFSVIRHDRWIAPAAARKAALPGVSTKYVAFVDNDILIERGCLGRLIDCAEETGAGLVCPLYIQAGGGLAPTIHMAGGEFVWSADDRRELVGERHRLVGQPAAAANGLARAKADFTEYHYVVGRMDLLGDAGAISDDILLIHEHLDLGLFARERGMDVIVEPAARATYVAFEPRPLSDLDFYRRRWDEADCRKSVLAFADKRLGANRVELVDQTFDYIAKRRHEAELRRRGSSGRDLDAPMTRAELAQDRHGLREQATARGYSAQELRLIDDAADLATALFDGLYRPDGRPFLSHTIGVASALVRYELDADIVRAGLLHSAYFQRPAWLAEANLHSLMGRMPRVATLARGQPDARAFLARGDADLMSLTTVGAAIFSILAANEVDMRLASEYRASGRAADLAPPMLERVTQVLALFGISGLAASAALPIGTVAPSPLFGQAPKESFRLDPASLRRLFA
jgi:glycosyltransferase involved in cell wall biosynthesis